MIHIDLDALLAFRFTSFFMFLNAHLLARARENQEIVRIFHLLPLYFP